MLKSVSAKEAKKIIEENKDIKILDVRTAMEFAGGNLAGSVNLDFYEPNFLAELNKLDKEEVYLIYCRSGSRSKGALEMMKQLGFKTVYELEYGIMNYL